MPNIKNQEKRMLTNAKSALANKSKKSAIKTALKAVEKAVTSDDKEVALTALNRAYKLLDQSVNGKIYHKNYTSRQKARLAKLVNKQVA